MFSRLSPELKRTFIACIIAGVGLFYMGGQWIFKQNIKRLNDYKFQRDRVQLENKVAKELSKLKKIREKIEPIKGSSEFLAKIAKLAGQMDLKLVTISAQPVKKHNEFTKFSVDIELDTVYHQVANFIGKIESDEMFMHIDSLTLQSKGTNQEGLSRLRAFITISTFYLADTNLEM